LNTVEQATLLMVAGSLAKIGSCPISVQHGSANVIWANFMTKKHLLANHHLTNVFFPEYFFLKVVFNECPFCGKPFLVESFFLVKKLYLQVKLT